MRKGSNERAEALTHIGPFSSHLSLRRLFLGGLLPSRARLRFTGWMTNVGSHEPDTIALIEYLLTCRGGAFGCRPGPRNDGPAEPRDAQVTA